MNWLKSSIYRTYYMAHWSAQRTNQQIYVFVLNTTKWSIVYIIEI